MGNFEHFQIKFDVFVIESRFKEAQSKEYYNCEGFTFINSSSSPQNGKPMGIPWVTEKVLQKLHKLLKLLKTLTTIMLIVGSECKTFKCAIYLWIKLLKIKIKSIWKAWQQKTDTKFLIEK